MAKQYYIVLPDQKIKLKRREYIIGRSKAQASIAIKHESISRQHAKLIVGKSSITIQDLGSANGTIIDDKTIKPNQLVMLRVGMKIKLGDYAETSQIEFEEIDSDQSLSRSRSNSIKQTKQKKITLEENKKQKIWNMGGLSKESQNRLKKLMGAKDVSDDEEQIKHQQEIEKRNQELELQYKRAIQRQKTKGLGL